ncbi:1-acylglycerol-3-phosphate O-acyltransferase [Saitoella coloradoensis]
MSYLLPAAATLLMPFVALPLLAPYLPRILRYYARAITSLSALCLCATYGVISSIVLRFVGKTSIAQWATARAYRNVLCPLIGVDFVVDDESRKILNGTRPAVFLSNHQTSLDVLMLAATFPKHCSVTAKKQLKHAPFLGWFMSLSGTVFIDRANRNNALASFASAVKTMKDKKQSVWIFPEGTRSNSDKPEMLPFKKGAFHLAIQAQVPIVPVVVQNYAHVFHGKTQTFESGDVQVKVLDPIPTEGLTAADVDRLVLETRDKMAAVLKEMHPVPTASATGAMNGEKKIKDEL